MRMDAVQRADKESGLKETHRNGNDALQDVVHEEASQGAKHQQKEDYKNHFRH